MKTKLIIVTAEDIHLGKCGNAHCCAIALAACRAFKMKPKQGTSGRWLTVTTDIQINRLDVTEETWSLPPGALLFRRQYDDGQLGQPFEFESVRLN